MEKKLDIVILTGGSPFLLPALERIAAEPDLNLVGMVYDRETGMFSLPLHRRFLSVWKYKGFSGMVNGVLRRMFRFDSRDARGDDPDEERQLTEFAGAHGVPLHVTRNVHREESIEFLRRCNADVGLVVGTRILKESVFSLPRMGSINAHTGIVPEYRGAGSVFWPLFNGAEDLGVSVHQVVAEVDSGALYVQKRIPLIYDYERYGVRYEVFQREVAPLLNALAADAILEALLGIARGDVKPVPIDVTAGRRYRRPTHRQKKLLRARLRERYEARK